MGLDWRVAVRRLGEEQQPARAYVIPYGRDHDLALAR